MYSPTSPRYAPASVNHFERVDFNVLRADGTTTDRAYDNAHRIVEMIAIGDPALVVHDGHVVLVPSGAPAAVNRVRIRARLSKLGGHLGDRLEIVDGALLFRYATDE